jgi:ABC-type antimicrobial peptide transport system permease subunit
MVLCLFAVAVHVQADHDPPANSYRVDNFAYASNGASQRIRGAYVTTSFFQAAKTQPWLGRLFLADEYQTSRGQVVVLCNLFWKQRFKGDPSYIGRTLQLNGRNFTIIGVMAPTFEFPSGVDVWIPR